MRGGVVLKDVAYEELEDAYTRLISPKDTGWIDIHAGREARWHPVDVVGARPMVVLSMLKRVLGAHGFSTRLIWGRPDMRRRAFRTPRPERCSLERQQMLTLADLDALGLERPDSEPLMGRWTTSACHVAVVDASHSSEPWVHGWDAEHPNLLAQLYVEWEIPSGCGRSYMNLHRALKSAGRQAVVMYLLSTRYGELLPSLEEGLGMAKEHVKRINSVVRRLHPDQPSPPELGVHVQAFEDALSNDLDTPNAFLALFDWIREVKASRCRIGDGDMRRMLWLLGMAPAEQHPPRRSSGGRAVGDSAGPLLGLSQPHAHERRKRDMGG
ncbi:MAG: hypothetical protein ACTHM1_12405 [Solirubrobacteraceae bacterium]